MKCFVKGQTSKKNTNINKWIVASTILFLLYNNPTVFAAAKDSTQKDSTRTLKFRIDDSNGDPLTGKKTPSFDLNDPSNLSKQIEYDPVDGNYYFTEKIGGRYYRTPTYLTREEYLKYKAKQDEQAYWRRRLDALALFEKKPQLPVMYKDGIFDRIFGGSSISVRPQGNVDVKFGGNWQNIKNPALTQRAQKYGIFDFDMQMNVNFIAAIGDKMKFNISNNTKATFDFQNVQKLDYTGKDDEIIKKIEAGNISFPLKSNLIKGVQSLFGLKTQLQFGKLWVTGVVSQQKSKKQSLTIQGGGQAQTFSAKADDYEENRHFLLGHYFREHYNTTLQNFPLINSLVTINKIEVWVTNRTGAVEGVRDILAFMDLGEQKPYNTNLTNAAKPVYPDNRANTLYDLIMQTSNARLQSSATSAALSLGFQQGLDFERTTARKLASSEYSFNAQLGYISLNTQLNPDDILAVSYRYTYNGQVFQVGEFAEDLPPDSTNTKVMYMKLLKGTSARPRLPIWNLMMKNIYALGGYGISKEDFRLNVLFQDPGGGEKRYLPEGVKAGVPLISVLNLDRLNPQNDPSPDGVFDFIEGLTINTQQGKLIFPVLEPFGADLLPAVANDPQLQRKYLYQILYDSTKTIARQFQQNNRYVMRGTYKSASSSEIFLGGFNIPQGSVSVTAGGQRLLENIDFQMDYSLGRIKITNTGILSSGIPINIQYEDNATFGFQQQNLMGIRLDYYLNEKFNIGSTVLKLTERPFTQKTTVGEDPIRNSVVGVDVNYQSESKLITRLLDKLPIYSTTAPSFLSFSAEGAGIFPGSSKLINTGADPEGAVYIDDFEGTRSSYDLKSPMLSWSLASTPVNALNKYGNILFPEATDNNKLSYGKNRAKFAWYFLEPQLVDPSYGTTTTNVKKDVNQHYIRLVQLQDVFPQRSYTTLQNALTTLDLGFYPKQRGPYNFDDQNVNTDGTLKDPQARWGGIMRPIEYSDFEASNVEFIEFWMLDPFINNNNPSANGSMYINLGNVSEDVMKDSRKFFENGIAAPKNPAQLDQSIWGYIPRFQQQITRAFDNDPSARAIQDVGYDGLNDEEEKQFFKVYLDRLAASFGTNSKVYLDALADPAADNFKHFRDATFDQSSVSVVSRYKYYNNPQGNSPIPAANAAVSNAATTLPETEDINRDNALSESEDYFQYRIDVQPNMQVGTNFIVSKQVSNVKLPNGNTEPETWYQFKIPIREYQQKIGNIADFRSIRFMRLYLNGFEDSVILRLAKIELGRNQWRQYQFSLQSPGENIPEADKKTTEFAITSVSLEENGQRAPVNYVMPPGIIRQQSAVSNGQNIQLNEQSLSLQVCGLKDGDARAVYKEVGIDMRQFSTMKMFIHAESRLGQVPIKDGDVYAAIRIGSDFTNNYYEYQIPLTITPNGTADPFQIWPDKNKLELILDQLVAAKTARNNVGLPSYIPFQSIDAKGNTIVVVGNPNVGEAKTIMLGILNPKKTSATPNDDGLTKCVEVWFNEMRMTGMNQQPGYAASGKVNIQLADLGSVRASGSMHTSGYGNIDQKLNQRFRDNFYQYDASTNLSLGKLLPKQWGVQLPFYVGYSSTISNPIYDPYDLDVKFADKLNRATSAEQRDSIKKAAQDFSSILSFNFTNVKIMGNQEKQRKFISPLSVKNFDFSYSYNKQFKRNSLIEHDEITQQKLGIGYTYSIKSKPIEPFKKLIKSRSKWWALIRDVNFNLVPSTLSFRTDLNRVFNETQMRTIGDASYPLAPTYFKNFIWNRTYAIRWQLTNSLSFDLNATNNSRIDEPFGRIDTKEKQDSLIQLLQTGGRNTLYTQNANASYNLPLNKFPLTDWTSLRMTYGTTYNWTAASKIAASLGNAIANTQNIQINGELNFTQLYNKSRWMRLLAQPVRTDANAKVPNAVKNLISKNNPFDVMDAPPSDDKKSGVKGAKENSANTNSKNPATNSKEDEKTKLQKAEEDKKLLEQQKNKIIINGVELTPMQIAKYSNKQLDSLKSIMHKQQVALAKAEKKKIKLEKKLARLQKRQTQTSITGIRRFLGKLLTMIKRTTINYTETGGTTLPGFRDSSVVLGLNPQSMQPGLNYVFGAQPTNTWFEQQANLGRLSKDTLFNGQLKQTFSQNLAITGTLEPISDLRVDLSLNKTFSKSHSELFKDVNNDGVFDHNNPYETGSFSMSYIGVKSMFKAGGANSELFNTFITNTATVSNRLGANNPYIAGLADPMNPSYSKGYTKFSQAVLIPSFIAAYSGKTAKDIPLMNNEVNNIKANPFKYFMPLPNWKLSYTGLAKLPKLKEIFTNVVVNHAYTGTLSMNGFVSSLFYRDALSIGFPSFIDSNSHNLVPFYQVPNITINEQFNPLLGVDVALKNKMTFHVEFKKSRTSSLSLIDYQVSEVKSAEFVFGAGWRVKGVVLPFKIAGVKKLKNDLNLKLDIGLRDDKTTNTFIAQNISVISRGQQVISISPSADYIVSDKITLRFFYDRRQTIPYVSNSFPMTTTTGGVTLRFIFAN